MAEPFRIHAGAADLADLKARLRATRWPDAPQEAGWSLGVDLGYLREFVGYWAEDPTAAGRPLRPVRGA